MGAALHARRNDSLPPLTVVGRTPLRAIDYATPVPSAQVKSAVLLAGLRAEGRTTVRESVATRDHTERMLRARGVPVERTAGPDGGVPWTIEGGVTVHAVTERVPGDVSAAAFWLVAAAIHPDAELVLRDVGVNPTRRAVDRHPALDGRRHRGAPARRPDRDDGVGEPVADLVVRSSTLRAVELGPGRRRRRDRRDPGPLPGGRGRDRHDRHPRRGRAPPQGVGPDRRNRGRPAGARRPDRDRRRRPDASRAAPPSTAPRPTASTTIAWR